MPQEITKHRKTTNLLAQQKPGFEIRQAASFDYAIEINKPRGTIENILDWSKQELTNEWRWQLVNSSSDGVLGRYIFYFDSEADYLAFVLKFA